MGERDALRFDPDLQSRRRWLRPRSDPAAEEPLRHQPADTGLDHLHAASFKPYEPPKSYEPPKLPSVYADGPFSPGGEAKRERKAEAAERVRTNGPFSPEGEAKRERAQAKHNAAINPF